MHRKFYSKVRHFFFFLLFLVLGVTFSSLLADEMAISAIQTLREANRPRLLEGLAELKGVHGTPQPEEWILLCNDPTARGGVRELTVKGQHIISERTPTGGFGGAGDLPLIDLTHLLIDSGPIFTAANREAVAHHLGFDYINYTLRADATTGKLLWVVQLYKDSETLVGTIQFSAETGAAITSFRDVAKNKE